MRFDDLFAALERRDLPESRARALLRFRRAEENVEALKHQLRAAETERAAAYRQLSQLYASNPSKARVLAARYLGLD